MNPITMAGGIAAIALLSYTHYVAFSAGKQNVQIKWNADLIVRKDNESKFKTRITELERGLNGVQKEAQDAHAKEDKAHADLLALQRTRSTAADGRLRDVNDQLTRRLARNADDSAALAECKATGTGYRTVFESCVGRYRELGEDAQVRVADAVARGLECERSYDAAERSLKALTVKGP